MSQESTLGGGQPDIRVLGMRLPTRVLSLRTIVIVSQLSVIALVLALGAWVWIGVTNDQYSQLDRRLDSVSSLGDINSLLNTAQLTNPDRPTSDRDLVRTARIGGVTVSVPSNVIVPKLANGYANTTINGVQYRVRTFSAGPASIALAAPLAEAQHRINELHLRVLLICAGVIGGTVLVGWVISLIMVNPFLLLAQQARAINAQSSPDEVQVRGVREAVEIAEAVEGMLARIGNEQQRTKAALEIDPAIGEFRVHYAGFFDPGFGQGGDGRPSARAVLEVRSRDVPFLLEDGQPVGRLVYEKLVGAPDELYGAGPASSYQHQGLKLSKHFRA